MQSRTGPGGGVWLHPQLAIAVAATISSAFMARVSSIVLRYFRGDMSLAAEVVQNYDAVNNTTSTTVVQSVDNDVLMEDRKLQAQLELSRAQLEARKLEWRMFAIQKMQELGMEQRDQVWIRDTIRNSALVDLNQQGGEKAIQWKREINLSDVCRQMGWPESQLRRQVPILGKKMKAAYVARHGHLPEQVDRYVDGAMRKVNIYYSEDEDLMQAVCSLSNNSGNG